MSQFLQHLLKILKFGILLGLFLFQRVFFPLCKSCYQKAFSWKVSNSHYFLRIIFSTQLYKYQKLNFFLKFYFVIPSYFILLLHLNCNYCCDLLLGKCWSSQLNKLAQLQLTQPQPRKLSLVVKFSEGQVQYHSEFLL